MTPFEIYLIMQLDTIKVFTTMSTIVSMLIMLPCAGMYFFDEHEQARKPLKIATISFLVLSFTSVVTPSTQTAATMFLAPTILNNETVQAEARELYNLAKEGLKQAVSQDKKEEVE